MDLVQFNVSARAAILIGRENIANSEGAIIELVKNCYDADSDFVIILINNDFTSLPEKISSEDYDYITSFDNLIEKEILSKIYEKKGEDYIFTKDKLQDVADLVELEKEFVNKLKPLSAIYIIDNGSGMSLKTIKDNWMTIGTANKRDFAITDKKKRVKSGAKGIGRFALDKLGGTCDLISINESSENSVYWSVDWTQFENPAATIDQVKAKLENISIKSLGEGLKYLSKNSMHSITLEKILEEVKSYATSKFSWYNSEDFFKGTIIKISNLHEIWNDKAVNNLFNRLEVLVPPAEINDFSLHILPERNKKNYGEVLTSYCDDYDYKIVAVGDSEGKVAITVHREEYDVEIIPEEFFLRPKIIESKYHNKEVFLNKKYTRTIDIREHLGNKVDDETLKKLGNFEFILYFQKKQSTTSNEKIFFYKKFDSRARKQWLDNFGGIKIYRDGFRVRPYGEMSGPAFDWLGLGQRKASSPASVAKPEGGYKVEPENISGVVKISRLNNPDFQDKSSREGLQESDSFMIFQNLLLEIIAILEKDRSFIASELKKFDDDRFREKRELEKAWKLAEELNKKKREKNEAVSHDNDETDDLNLNNNPQAEILANLIGKQNEEIEQLKDEQKMLRAMASSGIVSAALSHDVEKIRARLVHYADDLKDNILEFINENHDFGDDIFNPYYTLDKLKRDNDKIFTWLGFSLEFIKKDKRKRKFLNLKSYFERLNESWNSTFQTRNIKFILDVPENIEIKAFEVDFDSIFINLFTNTIEAFDRPNLNNTREIHISASEISSLLQITYKDTGPGLCPSILDPEEIFNPQVTTKKDEYGSVIGTGLGMWIIKKTIDEYKGDVKLINTHSHSGFGLRLSVPGRSK
jgi:signal transduction histidine kinase